MSCMPQNVSSIFDHSGRDMWMSFVFHTHDLTNILRKRLILQQSVERGLMSFKSSSLNKGACLAFRRFPDSKVGSKVHLHRFFTRTVSICQHRQGVDPVSTRIGDSALFLDSTCFFTCPRASQSKLWRFASRQGTEDTSRICDEHSAHLSDSFVQMPASH